MRFEFALHAYELLLDTEQEFVLLCVVFLNGILYLVTLLPGDPAFLETTQH